MKANTSYRTMVTVLILATCVYAIAGGPANRDILAERAAAAKELNAQITWSVATNNVKAGVWLTKETKPFRVKLNGEDRIVYLDDWRIIPSFLSTNPTRVIVWLPPVESRCELSLRAKDSTEVGKTKFGKTLGSKVEIGDKGISKSGFVFTPADNDFPSTPTRGFKLSDVFTIDRPGIYHLEIRWRALVLVDDELVLTEFDPITVKVELNETAAPR